MEPKKNPKADIGKNSGLYFVIGLFAVMLMTYIAFENKTYPDDNEYDTSMNIDDELDEEVPMTEQIKTPPPPPPLSRRRRRPTTPTSSSEEKNRPTEPLPYPSLHSSLPL